MTYDSAHLPPWTLEELAEDTLSPVERALALDHVRDCSRCAADLDVSRAVIAALAALPAFAPSPGFADAVMARVAVPDFAESAEQARVRRWLPRSQKGWMFFLGGVLAPIAPLMALLTWLLGYPGVSAASLWGVARDRAADAAWGTLVRGTETVVRTPAFEWLVTTGNEMVGGSTGLSLAALLFAVAIPLSGLALLRILRTPVGGMSHA